MCAKKWILRAQQFPLHSVQGKLLYLRTHFWHTSLCVCQHLGSQAQQVPKQARRALFRVIVADDRDAYDRECQTA